MPYQGETASPLGHVATANSRLIADVLATYETVGDDGDFVAEVSRQCIPASDLDLTVHPTSVGLCLSIDGSRQQTVVERGERQRAKSVGFVRVGASYLDLDAYRSANAQTVVDPRALARTHRGVAIDYVLPGAGVNLRGATTRDSWRKALNSFFAAAAVNDDDLYDPQGVTVTFAEALILLGQTRHTPPDKVAVRHCPSCGLRDKDAIDYVGVDGGSCPECRADLYLADYLGLDAAISSENSRENALTVTMNAAERLALVAFLEMMRRRSIDELASTLVVADGPLAAFGPLAPLTRPMRRYIDDLAEEVLYTTGRPLLLVGVEKGGEFASHGESIADLIPRGHAMRMTNDYITTHITGRGFNDKPYGQEHLYGRRFFYRRHDGHLLTVTVPAAPGIVPWSLDAESEDWASYPTLRVVLTLLESLKSSRHQGAVLPLVFAHAVTSLPMGTGQAVLTLVGQNGLGLNQNTRLREEPRRTWG